MSEEIADRRDCSMFNVKDTMFYVQSSRFKVKKKEV
jgi:hypothetical protein